MSYSWASITLRCKNYGNRQIEYGLERALQQSGFSLKPSFTFDTFAQPDDEVINKVNATDFLLIPGCTTLVLAHYPALKHVLSKVTVPVFNFGTTLSTGYETSPELYDRFKEPIGTRDPFADNYLGTLGFKTKFVGCPTLFTGSAKEYKYNDSNKVVFILGTHFIDEQLQLLQRARSIGFDVRVIIQEEKQRQFFTQLSDIPQVEYTPQNYIEQVKDARLVVTGRLHGALPALSLGTPVFFLKVREDTRFSLLDYLAIPLNYFDDNTWFRLESQLKDPMLSQSEDTFKNVNLLRNQMLQYIDWFQEEIQLFR